MVFAVRHNETRLTRTTSYQSFGNNQASKVEASPLYYGLIVSQWWQDCDCMLALGWHSKDIQLVNCAISETVLMQVLSSSFIECSTSGIIVASLLLKTRCMITDTVTTYCTVVWLQHNPLTVQTVHRSATRRICPSISGRFQTSNHQQYHIYSCAGNGLNITLPVIFTADEIVFDSGCFHHSS